MEKKIVYIDMDGVLVNFGAAIQDWFDKHPHLEERWKDMPDHIQGLFRNPPPIEGAIEAVKKQETKGIEIDLTGPQGNAYFLMGTARKLGRQLCWDEDEIQTLLKQMTRGDYENLVNTFDKYFGNFVTLYR